MKSISQGTSTWRIRSARKRTAPLSTPTMKRSLSAYSSLIWRPSSATRRCSSSLETRVSPIEGSLIAAQSRYSARFRSSALGAQHAPLHHRAHAAAEIEPGDAGPAQGGDLVGVVCRARDRAPGGAVGEALNDEPAQGRRQLGEPAQLDRAALGSVGAELGVDQRVEHLGLVAQQLGRAQDVASGGGVNL